MTAEELLAGIRDGDAHFGGIRCLRLFRVERELALALRHEIDRLCETEMPSDVLEAEHVTHWAGAHGAVRQYSLLNRNGDFADYRDDHDLSCRGKFFHHGDRYPRLAGFIDGLVHAINVRVNVLGASASLAPHEEHSLFMSKSGTAAVRARFHMPVHSSRAARMLLDGEVHHFAPRNIYYFNQGCVHGADNPGHTNRVHLVWDQILTPEVFELMFGAGCAPAGLTRYPPDRRAVPAKEHRSELDFVRLAPLVTRWEAHRVALGQPQ